MLWQTDILSKHKRKLPIAEPHRGLQERLTVYRLKDLESLRSNIERLWWDLFYFNGYLRQMAESSEGQWLERLAMPHLKKSIAAHAEA